MNRGTTRQDQADTRGRGQLQAYAEFIRQMVARHGPAAEDDGEVRRVADDVYRDLHAGRLVMRDIHYLRAQFGESLSSCATLQGHALAKPYGYPGDFELFDKIFLHHVSPDPRFQRWDEFFHRLDACKAVRNRKSWLVEQLGQKHLERARPLQVLIVGSGPGRSVYEFLERYPHGARFDCVELDPKAIDYAAGLCNGVSDRVRFRQGSILRYRTETRYDVIWSGGLFDYFNDRVFVRGLTHLVGLLGEGGELIIGNFASPNSSQAFMELISDWRLTLRTPAQLHRLAAHVQSDGIAVRSGQRAHGGEPLSAALPLMGGFGSGTGLQQASDRDGQNTTRRELHQPKISPTGTRQPGTKSPTSIS